VSLRCAAYARYSSDKQSPLSIDDQLRMCREYVNKLGWTLLDDHVYREEALSGVGTNDRPALARLMEAALSRFRPFDVILVDDTSRLSRNLAESARIYERLNFAGIRVVAVSQGIDTQSEQSDVLVTVHGLVDSLYVKELAKKTHRGLEGKVLRGFHAGGRCYGYRNVQGPDGVRLEVNEADAQVIRRIFEMYASGYSLKAIAKTLNAEKVPSPRPRAGKRYASWCPTAIHAMLRRERCAGKEVWNRSRFIKAPGTNKRLRRARPRNEWRIRERPELRIVSGELWRSVQNRLAQVKQTYGNQSRQGLLTRAASSRYLLSGFLKCARCGANLTIVSGRSGDRYPRYGCPQNFYRGTCPNDLKERQDWLEDRLLSQLLLIRLFQDGTICWGRRRLRGAIGCGCLKQTDKRKPATE
jgi:site-specific DNA recombinase